MLKLHSVNIGGNIHSATTAINRWGWAEYLIHLDSVSGSNTIAVFRMPAEKVWEIRENEASYIADPHHDDYRGKPDPYSAFTAGGAAAFTWPVDIPTTRPGLDDEQEAADEQLEMHNPGIGEAGYRDGTTEDAAETPAPETPAETPVAEVVVPAKKPARPKKEKVEAAPVTPMPVNPDQPVNLDNLPDWAR